MLVIATKIIGPSLEQLDYWGDLDSLQWSLDSEVWLTASMLESGGNDNQAAKDSMALIETLDMSASDAALAKDTAHFDLHYFPKPVADKQPACDRVILSFKGWGWEQVPRPKINQWEQVG